MSIAVTNSAELRQALENAPSGTTIFLAAGDYEGPFEIASDNLTLVGSGLEETRLRGTLSGLDQVSGFLLRNLNYDPMVFRLDGAADDAGTASADEPGWVTDRAALESQAVVPDPLDLDNDVLSFTTRAEGATTGFYAYQGAQYRPTAAAPWQVDLGNGADVSCRLYVDPAFEGDGVVQKTGLWLGFQNAEGGLDAGGWYAILEYVDADGAAALNVEATQGGEFTGGFRIWLDNGAGGSGDWLAFNHSGTGWVDLQVRIEPDAAALHFLVDGAELHTAIDGISNWGSSGADIARLDTVTINSGNDSGVATTYHYDDLALSAHPTGHAVYGVGWSLSFADGQWLVADDEQQLALRGVDRIEVDGVAYALVGGDAFGSIQAAIDAAAAGDTVLVPAGTYAESLQMNGKPLNLVGLEGAEVIVDPPASGNALILQGSFGAESSVVIRGIDFTGADRGVLVKDGTTLGVLGIDDAHFSGIARWGVMVGDGNYGEGPATALGQLIITDSAFVNVGANEPNRNGTAVKLWRFQGDLAIEDTVFFGNEDGQVSHPGAPASAIEMQGVDNQHLTDVPPIGTVTLADVTISGGFAKNPVGIFNYGAYDTLTIDGLDLSGAASAWTGLLNIDSSGALLDTSEFNLVLPPANGPVIELQGEKTAAPVDNHIIGTAAAELLNGKYGADTLAAGGGNDKLIGGQGIDTAVFSGNVADYRIEADRDAGGWIVTDLRGGSPDGTDLLVEIEYLEFADGLVDVATLSASVTWVVDASGAGDFTSLQAAIQTALAGDTILVRSGTYTEQTTFNSSTIGLVIDKPLSIVGVSGPHDAPVTDSGMAVATIVAGAESVWGTNFMVTAAGVSIHGLRFEAVARNTDPAILQGAVNKAFEITAGGFELTDSVIAAREGYSFADKVSTALYFGDAGADDLESFRVEGNLIGGGITITNGAGDSGTADFVITDNVFSGSHFLRVRGIVEGVNWLTARAGLPGTVSGNDFSSVTGILLQNWDEDSGQLADAEFVAALLADNTAGPYAYVTTADGAVRTVDYTEYGGTAPAVLLGSDPAEALGLAHATDTLVIRGDGGDAGDLAVEVDGLTVRVDGTSGLNLSLGEQVTQIALAGSGSVDVTGNALDNAFTGNDAGNHFEGGAGNDTLHLQHVREQYAVTFSTADGSYTIAGPEGVDTLYGVEQVTFAGGEPVDIASLRGALTWNVTDSASLADALEGAVDGDTILLAAGTYTGGITLSRGVSVVGLPGATLEGDGSGVGITIAASGVSLTGISVRGYTTGIGFAQTGETLEDLLLERVSLSDVTTGIAGLNQAGGTNNSGAKVDGLQILGLSVSTANQGICFDVDPSGGALLNDVTVDGAVFSMVATKGIYVEALSNASLRNLTMANVGQAAGQGLPGNGIDINLKYGTYVGIVIDGFTFTNVGGATLAGDAAISVKARDDGSYAGNPGVYSGTLSILNGWISGTGTGVQVGEPGAHNAGPNVLVEGVKVSGHQTTGNFGAFNNFTTGELLVHGAGAVVDTGAASHEVHIFGGAGNDTLSGTRGTDVLDGKDGNDILTGGTGDDALDGGAGNDILRGGDGNDALVGGQGDDTLEGAAGDDLLSGDAGDDLLRGGDGDDRLQGGAGNDLLEGGAGVDTAVFSGNRTDYAIRLQDGIVVVTHRDDGPDGIDTLTQVETLQFQDKQLDLTAGILVFDAQGVLKSLHADLGTALAAAVDGDVVELRAGTHVLDAGGDFAGLTASITLRGANAGIAGGAARGNESVIQLGPDALQVLGAGVTFDGVLIEGTVQVTGSGFILRNSWLDGGAGAGLLLEAAAEAVIGTNHIAGDTGILARDFGTLTISGNVFEPAGTGLRLEPGDAAEHARVIGNTFSGGVYGVSLQGSATAYANAVTVTVSGNTFLTQSGAGVHADAALPGSLDESLGASLPLNQYGTSPQNAPARSTTVLFASEQGDLIVGTGEDDALDGTGGDDIIRGGGGNDTISGGAGNDRIYGGAGTDVAVFSGGPDDYEFARDEADGAVVVSGPDGVDRLHGVERVRFGAGPDVSVADLPGIAPVSIAIDASGAGGAVVLQNALDSLLMEGDSVTVSGDLEGVVAAISGNASIGLNGVSGLGLHVSDDAGRTKLILAGTGSINIVGNSAGTEVDASGVVGDATLSGGNGNDVMKTGSGNDTVVASHGGGLNIFDAGSGTNLVTLTSAAGGVVLDLDAGTLDAGFVQSWAADEQEVLQSAMEYVGSSYGIEYHDSGTDPDSSALLFGFSNVTGGVYDDLLIGNAADNTIDGYGGSDDLIGKDGNDAVLFGGAAQDYEITRLGAADVAVRNQAIAGRLDGFGMANDGFDANLPVFRVRYVGTDAGFAGVDAYAQVETLRFGAVEYTIAQDGEGAYFLQLADGGVTYAADAQLAGDDYVWGGSGADHLTGAAGDDHLHGGEGADTLVGGSGSDYLDGGEAGDVYEVAAADIIDGDLDVIADSGSTGTDTLLVKGGGTADLRGFTVTGIEQVAFSTEGNTLLVGTAGDWLAGVSIAGSEFDDALDVHFSRDGGVTLIMTEVETLRLHANGRNLADLAGIGTAAVAVATGAADDELTLTSLDRDLDASGYGGSLLVSGVERANFALTTGNRATQVASDGAEVAVVASQLADDARLTLTGSTAYTVTGLMGDVDASGTTGLLNVITGDNAGDGTIGVTTGSATATIRGSDASDTVNVDATALLSEGTLTLQGGAAFVVTGLSGSLDARDVLGNLTVIATGQAAQELLGGQGADLLTGGGGGDFLDGGASADLLKGGDGDDLLFGGADTAIDSLLGGAGTDRAIFIGSSADYEFEEVRAAIDGQQDVRVLKVTNKDNGSFDYVGTDVESLVFVSDIDAYRDHGTKNDEMPVAIPPICLFDGNGQEIGSYASLAEALSAAPAGSRIEIDDFTDLSGEEIVDIGVDNLTIAGAASVQIEGLRLGDGVVGLRLEGSFSTVVYGNDLNNVIVGNAGANTLFGGAGSDLLVGGGGDDLLSGGDGDDRIILGARDGGRVMVQGGAGSDRFILDASNGDGTAYFNVSVLDFRSQQDVLDFGHLLGAGGEPLTLADLGLVASSSARIGLDAFLLELVGGQSQEVSGTLGLSGVNAMRMAAEDFSFDQPFDWRALLEP